MCYFDAVSAYNKVLLKRCKMRSLQNIQSLTSFKRNTVESVEQLKKSQSPLILTVNGKAELVVLGAEDYENLLERVERAERIKAIQYGIEAFEKGEYKPAREALAELKDKYEL
jgi:PHD/YefM family antitoxin component YafN of YafNO toxin-antitoxin module